MIEIIFDIFNSAILLAVAVICLIYPHRVQDYTIKHTTGSIFEKHYRSDFYRFAIRSIGIASLIVFVLMIYLLFIKGG